MPFTPTPHFLAFAANALANAIGKPWQVGGRGPNEFDCWGIVWWIYAQGGKVLPDWSYSEKESPKGLFQIGISEAVGMGFTRLEKPEAFAIVPMGRGLFTSHVAIYFNGLFYHCGDKTGVVGQPIEAIHSAFANLSYWYPNAS